LRLFFRTALAEERRMVYAPQFSHRPYALPAITRAFPDKLILAREHFQ